MNDTVARIVEIMFQETDMTEEVAAIRDEVMNNCQERYEDMIVGGMDADDAVAAVIESLKGMEEVIAQYPKKTSAVQTDAFGETPADGEGRQYAAYAYTVESIHGINVTMVSENVKIEASEDELIHVEVKGDAEEGAVTVSDAGGLLRIRRDERRQTGRPGGRGRRASGHFEIDLDGDVSWKDVDSLEKLGQKLGQLFRGIKTEMFAAADGVILRIPEGYAQNIKVLTTSGDVDVEDVPCRELRIVSTSGDVDVRIGEEHCLRNADIITTSGDIEATVFSDSVDVSSTSGDVEVEGCSLRLNTRTVSGDVDVRAETAEYTFKTVSGDVDAAFDSDELRRISGSSMSGDIDVILPKGVGFMQIEVRSMSGDVRTNCCTNGFGPTVTGSITTMSGDIDIR